MSLDQRWRVLALHATTGVWTLPVLSELPSFWGPAAPVIGWILDALSTATLNYAGKIALDAIGLPAMKGFMMKAEFMKSFEKDAKD